MSSASPRAFEVTHKSVLAIALPTTLAYLSTPILGLVDTGVVGRLGEASLLGGLAVGAVLFDIVFSTFYFIRASTTGLVAQAVGAKDDEAHRTILVRALLIALFFGTLALLVYPTILSLGIWGMDISPAIENATRSYFTIRILAAPVTLINFSILGWLLGLGRAGVGLLLQTVLNGTNVALSILLGLYWEWGIEGVAWATVVAEFVAMAIGLLFAWRYYREYAAIHWLQIFDRAALLKLMGVNGDIMVRSFALLFVFAFFTAQGSRFGELTLAANAVLMNFFLISGYFLDGFATAAEQLAGKAVGARYRPAFDRVVKLTLFWGAILAGCATVAFFAFGPWLIDTLTTVESVRSEARIYLFWAALTALMGVVAFQMDGIFIGATWSSDMRNMMLISLIVFLVSWWIAVPLIGNHGLWLALEIFLVARGITLFLRLRTKASQTFN